MNAIRLDLVLSLKFRRKRRALWHAVTLLSCLGLASLITECDAQVRLKRDLEEVLYDRKASIDAEIPDCEENQYYDTMAFLCRACPTGRVADAA